MLARTVGSLSGGERQRLQLARAIAQEPKLLFLDISTNHLDPRARGELLELVAEIGIAVVAVLHDLSRSRRSRRLRGSSGVIGFVGLMIPHLARPVAVELHLRLVIARSVFRAAIVLASDLLARVLLAPRELLIGIVTSSSVHCSSCGCCYGTGDRSVRVVSRPDRPAASKCQAAAVLSCLAASAILTNAGRTSPHLRVFRPQSG